MPQKEQQIVLEFCNAWGDGATARPDVNKIISMFAEDGVWQLWVPGGPTIMHCGITKMISSGSIVVTERLDHFTMHGLRQ